MPFACNKMEMSPCLVDPMISSGVVTLFRNAQRRFVSPSREADFGVFTC